VTVPNGSWRAVFELPAGLQAPATARHLVSELLRGWGLAAITDDAVLAVSEIVANAVQHAPGSGSHLVEVVRGPDRVRVSVADDSPALPIMQPVETSRPHGRGLRIVATLGAAWGAELLEGGKRVWVEFPVPASSTERAGSSATGAAAAEVLGFPAVAITDQVRPPAVFGPSDGGTSAAGDAAPVPE
jgi:anti-sigma regulatory factor (Ser/Thr protein kinase)